MWTNALVDAIVDQISSNSAQQFLSGFCDSFKSPKSFRFQNNLGLKFASLVSVCHIQLLFNNRDFVQSTRVRKTVSIDLQPLSQIGHAVHEHLVLSPSAAQLVQPRLSEDRFTRGQSAVGDATAGFISR